ncbi:MAG: thiamine phosphate synthase [Lysinibacillus sp.]
MIYAVTSQNADAKRIARINERIASVVDYICVREKLDVHRRREIVRQSLENGVPKEKLIVNSDIELALTENLAGVHFTEFDRRLIDFKRMYPTKMAGQSTHSLSTAQLAERNGADYIFFGHIFPSSSKKGVSPQGLKALHEICHNVAIPVIAIGGIDLQQRTVVLEAGASGVAMISTFFQQEDLLATSIHTLQREKVEGEVYE